MRNKPKATPDSTLRLLKDAADWLYNEDEEVVESGCADVSGILLEFAQRRELNDVHVVAGWASRSKNAKQGFPHVWLMVDGKRFDPVAHARGVKFLTYVEDAALGQLAVSGSYLDPDGFSDYGYLVDALERHFRFDGD